MTDTVRTTAELLTLLADSQPAHASNRQLLRDIVSSFGVERKSIVSVMDAPYNAIGDGITDDTVALQAALDSGNDFIFPKGTSYKTTALLRVTTSGQRLSGYGATINTIGLATSGILIGYTGAAFVKTDNVTIEGLNFVGQADGTNPSVPYAIGIYPPPTVPYAEGAGCSHITIRDCSETGYCMGVSATGADDIRLIDFRGGGNHYCAGLGAGGYVSLWQTCFRISIVRIHASATATDRHAIYISADPNRTFDNNNVCKHVQIIDPDIDWTGVHGVGPTGFEAPIEIRSPENCLILGGNVRGGYGGADFDAQNGNGKNFRVIGTTFDGQISNGVNGRSCISVTRASGAYLTDGVVIGGCTLKPSTASCSAISLAFCKNVNVRGNVGAITNSNVLVQIAGTVTDALFGGNTWNNSAGTTYIVSGAGNANITFDKDHDTITSGGIHYTWTTFPSTLRFGYTRRAIVSANATGAPVITSDPDGIIAAVSNNANGLNVTLLGSVDTPDSARVLFHGTGGGVCTAFYGSVAGQVVVLGVQDFAGAVLPGASNSYSIAVEVLS